MVVCLEQGADMHTAQLMPLPLTVSCFTKIQIGFTFLVLAYLGSFGKGPLNGYVCVCVWFCYLSCCSKSFVWSADSSVGWVCNLFTALYSGHYAVLISAGENLDINRHHTMH